MKIHSRRKGRGEEVLASIACALVFALLSVPAPARGSPRESAAVVPVSGEAVSAAKSASLTKLLVGEWIGARLLCRKEEDNAVRCGKPVSFSVVFREDGTGSSNDEHFPNAFTLRWKTTSELILTSVPEGQELTLFQFELEKGFLTFQTYIYLATQDSELPKEANYIHYIFDVHRLQ